MPWTKNGHQNEIGYGEAHVYGSGRYGVLDTRSGDEYRDNTYIGVLRWVVEIHDKGILSLPQEIFDEVEHPKDSAHRVANRLRGLLEYQGFQYIGFQPGEGSRYIAPKPKPR